ncbi:MAG: BadF/BadG/BcrA/BcrD ATPase family protein, partial [Rhodospirillales bacterium]|nr:BadF/BadG/BcrA/BcrD ATPase family protein [Rhodospirillales bacterium]
SIAARTFGLLRRVGIKDEISFTGGVAKNIGMIKAMEDKLEIKMNVSDDSHYMGALGAALFSLDSMLAGEPRKTQMEVA